MFKIVTKKELNSAVTLMEIEAPFVAKKAKAGQFIIFRIDEQGERVPLTIAGYDREKGTVSIIFQKVGFSTLWASPPPWKARSASVWLAAVLAAPSHCPPLWLSRKPVLRLMSLLVSAARKSSFWRTSSVPQLTICT